MARIIDTADSSGEPKRIALLREINALGIVALEDLAASPVAGLLYPGLEPPKLRQRLQITLQQLTRSDLVKIGQLDGDTIAKATAKGKRKLLRYDLDQMTIERPKKWDGRWRMVVFDIPEKYKVARNALNLKLRNQPLFKLADSIWVSPYPVDGFIEALRQAYEVDDYVRLIHASYIEDERLVRTHFNLSA